MSITKRTTAYLTATTGNASTITLSGLTINDLIAAACYVNDGTIAFSFPDGGTWETASHTSGTLGVLGLGLLALTRRRRRSA